MIPRSLVLENAVTRLEPLDFRHAADLFAAGNDEELWRKAFRGHQMPTMEATLHYIGEALYGNVSAPGGVPFAIIDKATRTAIGCTRYLDISPEHRRLEIGWTWIARAYWRTHVNTNCKLLLLGHAFEVARAVRVQFKIDSRNDRSRAAVERLGATYEGDLRAFRSYDGGFRDSSCYSILQSEWPGVKKGLLERLAY